MNNVDFKVLENLLGNLMDKCEEVFEASGSLIAAIPEEKRNDAVFDFVNDVCDGEYNSVEEAMEILKEAVLCML